MSGAGLEDLNPFLVLAKLLVALVSGLLSFTVLVETLLFSLFVLAEVSMAVGEAGVGELQLSDLEAGRGAELLATPEESLVAGPSGWSA